MFKTFVRGAGATALAVGLLAGGGALAAPAHAASVAPAALTAPAAINPATQLTVKSISTQLDNLSDRALVFSGAGCKTLEFYVAIKFGDRATGNYTLTTDVARGNTAVAKVTTKNTGLGKATICPSKSNQRYGYPWHLGWVSANVEYWDANNQRKWVRTTWKVTSKTFAVKAALKGPISAQRRGNNVTFTVKPTYFSDKYQKWVAYNPTGATLQYKSGSTWRSVKTLRFSGGKAVYTHYSPSSRLWRINVPVKTWVVGGQSSGLYI